MQLERLRKTVSWAGTRSAFYQKKFTAVGLSDLSVESLDDIRRFPVTVSMEVTGESAYDFLTLPLSSILRISSLERLIRMYTAHDVAVNVEAVQRQLVAAGLGRTEVAGLFGNLAESVLLDFHSALEIQGVTTILLGEDYERAAGLLQEAGVNAVIGEPKDVLPLLEAARAGRSGLKEYPLSRVICINSTLFNPWRKYIEQRFGAKVTDVFASAVFGSAGLFYECPEGQGWHLQADRFLAEVIPVASKLADKENCRIGELVVTTLQNEAMPVIRYRTGQLVRKCSPGCSCGSIMPLYRPLHEKDEN